MSEGGSSARVRRLVHYYPRALAGDGGPTVAMWGWAQASASEGIPTAVLYDAALAGDAPLADPAVDCIAVAHHGRGRTYRPSAITPHLRDGDVLVLHSSYVLHNLIAARQARRRGTPYIVMPHGGYDPRSRSRHRWRKRAVSFLERRLLEDAEAVHLFFASEIPGLRSLAPNARVVVAPTGWSAPGGPQWDGGSGGYIAWFGRFDIGHKGLDLLAGALASIPAPDRPPVRVHGPESMDARSDVEALFHRFGLSGTVQVGGPVTGPSKESLLRHAIGWVHPSRWESHAIALVEALAAGLPCVVSRGAAIAPLLEQQNAAIVVDPDPASIGHGLRALADPSTRERLSHAGRRFVTEELAWERCFESFAHQLGILR